jgi:hypothetical protein
VRGLDAIKKVIDDTPKVEDVRRTSVDAHSCNGGVMLLVTGSMVVGSVPRDFVQNFFLSQTAGGMWCVSLELRAL